ncbi:MAG TPA: hypothetical protein DCR40_13815 [Prolixibacteraceae bacterium]|nr:hypothetical protein [Prolixibacteraceae bacterium]
MKAMISTFCLVLFSLGILWAQENIVLDDFESGTVGFTTEVHVNPASSFDIAVVDNPVKAGINLSNKVWEWKRHNTGDNQNWAGFWASLKNEVPEGYSRIEVKYLRKNATSQLRIKCEGTVTKEFNAVAPASKTNEWETMVFDLTANGIKNIKVLALFPDYYTPIDPAAVVYIDDIKVIYEKIVLPIISSLTLFSNSTSDRFHDQSWVNKTAPSTVVAVHWDPASAEPGDKLPCVTTPVKAGANALKLQWKSVEGGAWMALVAAVGWTSFDLTKMKELKFWVNSPVALAKTTLPKFFFESHSGTPNKTGKLLLGSYVTADLAANTWTEVIIPLADLWAADATFTAKNVVKGIFFEQNSADNVEHILYLDEFKFNNTNIVVDDFESGTVSFTTEIHGNPPAHFDYAVVDNPYKTGINTSNKVWEWKRYDAGTENKTWAGFWAVLKNEVPSGYHRIEVKFLRKNATSQLRIKCEGAITKEFNAITPASKTNVWETMVFDLTANGIKNIKVLAMFPDYYEPIDVAAISYIDDITVIFDETVVPPPPPTSLTLFDNSASDRFHDQSWVNQTAPSTVVTEHWEAAGRTDGDKLPVVTTPVKAGTNALKLQWKSTDTGGWMALVASVGWKAFDLTTMKQLKFWVYSPVVLAKTALPKFFFESHSGNPNKSGKLPLANYLPNGLVANTWTEVSVPLADVWAADATFVAKDVVKGVFFEQNTADNVSHTLYLDEFTFTSSPTGLDIRIEDKNINAYYTHGEIHISNYSGYVRVFDLVGRNVAEGAAFDGKLSVNLTKGIYIVNTNLGNTKIVLQ